MRILKGIFRCLMYVFIVIVVLVAIAWLIALRVPVKEPKLWGVTFSPLYAKQLGLDWREVYGAMFDDLHVRHVRISAYWSSLEATQNKFQFDDLDFQVKKASDAGADIIVAVGRKVPRWPECHEPQWVKSKTQSEQDEELLAYMRTVIERYKNEKAIIAWQVENEPFLAFGECPQLNVALLDREISLVKSIDASRPIIVTDSGELSMWVQAAKRGDIFGTTMYRTIYSKKVGGYFTYPLPPQFFRFKRAVTEMFVGTKPMLVIELQGEPWGPGAVEYFSSEERDKSLSPQKFKDIIVYAKASGFDEFYLWGVEWWYWSKTKQNEPVYWNIAKDIFTHI